MASRKIASNAENQDQAAENGKGHAYIERHASLGQPKCIVVDKKLIVHCIARGNTVLWRRHLAQGCFGLLAGGVLRPSGGGVLRPLMGRLCMRVLANVQKPQS